MNDLTKYFVWNFIGMFIACLFVDLITWIARHEADIIASFVIAIFGAGIFTAIKYFKDK
jgi:hypothetical protein